ncbi:MAG TPA: ATP-binding protein [Clostridiaceae bacterium]|nr:ATP-binding protein [Clostridiaceae bacterium]
MNSLDIIKEARFALKSLTVYRNLLQDKVFESLSCLLECFFTGSEALDPEKTLHYYCQLFNYLSTSDRFISLKNYIIESIILNENPFSLQAEKREFSMIDSALKEAAKSDLHCLEAISRLSSEHIKDYLLNCPTLNIFKNIINNLPSWNMSFESIKNAPASYISEEDLYSLKEKLWNHDNWNLYLEQLCNFYNKWGCGIFSRYKAFIWEHSGTCGFLKGVESPDPITLSDLIGYEEERQIVIENTLHFLRNYPANNILLYGDRGTGKSSTVKAILNEFFKMGLRVIEVPKKDLIDFPKIIDLVEKRKHKFIFFVDDLAFEDNEENYTALKAVLEGSLEIKPANVLIYATSNRRHLIKEKFSDRAGLHSGIKEDEIRAGDTIQEKLSLSDRFGITVSFISPDKKKYLKIVEGIAVKRGLNVDTEYLHTEALKWELWYNGRSPRTARQFIDWLESKLSEK